MLVQVCVTQSRGASLATHMRICTSTASAKTGNPIVRVQYRRDKELNTFVYEMETADEKAQLISMAKRIVEAGSKVLCGARHLTSHHALAFVRCRC
jgi:hypothetical protein